MPPPKSPPDTPIPLPSVPKLLTPARQPPTLRPNMKNIFPALAAAALLAACAPTLNTHGNIILPSRLAAIHTGQTSQDEVLQLLGTPSAKSTFQANQWYYITSTDKVTALKGNQMENRKVVAIAFDPSGTVSNLHELTEADGKTFTPDATTTKTQGQSLGILEQLMGNLGIGAP